MDLLLATSNSGKVEELARLLAPLGVTLRTLAEFPNIVDFPENEPTFEANAAAKTRYYVEHTGLPAIADDGGIEIDTFNGWPGVHSRRIFGDGRRATDEEMIAEVLRRMADIPVAQRGCQMRTVVSFVAPDGTSFQAEGIDRGIIAEHASERRISGFPFRSLFLHPAHGFITADALAAGISTDDVMTHRRDAVAKLLPQLRTWFLQKVR